MPMEVAMGIMAFILIAPVVIGGMKADVMTDVVQFILMLFMLALIVPFALSGLQSDIAAGVPEGYLNPFSYISAQEIAVFFILLFFLPITSAPLYQRFFASESEASARKSVLYSIATWMAIDSITILCGFAALRLYPDLVDPDTAFIVLGTALPVAARSIFFVGLLAAIMTTANSFLQSGASSLAYDVFRNLKPATSEGQLLALSRLLVIVLGVLSLVLALWFQRIVPALLFTLTMWTAGILVPTLAALTGRKLRRDTALYSLLGGALSALVWKIVQPFDVDAVFVGLGFSLLVAIASEVFRADANR